MPNLIEKPTAEEILAIEPGDRITFKSPTRDGCKKATRVVSRISESVHLGPRIMVKSYIGWADFVVKPTEILEIHKQEESK